MSFRPFLDARAACSKLGKKSKKGKRRHLVEEDDEEELSVRDLKGSKKGGGDEELCVAQCDIKKTKCDLKCLTVDVDKSCGLSCVEDKALSKCTYQKCAKTKRRVLLGEEEEDADLEVRDLKGSKKSSKNERLISVIECKDACLQKKAPKVETCIEKLCVAPEPESEPVSESESISSASASAVRRLDAGFAI